MSFEKHQIERMEQTTDGKEVCDDLVPDDISPLENSLETLEVGKEYPSGIKFILLTIGLMAVVLMVALDNFIICEFKP